MTAAAGFRSTDSRAERTLVTPEGIALRLELASVSQRLGAFVIDLSLMLAVLVALTIVLLLAITGVVFTAPSAIAFEIIAVIWLLCFFALRNLWFIGFECGRRTATPGKRAMGIRVIARDGGRLNADAVVARNMLRELEFFLPLSFISYEAGTGAGEAWTALAGLGWSLSLALFPLFNRDRLRLGDLIAGTWVLRTPRRRLGRDVADPAAAPAFRFTEAQLDAYGVYELQKLEAVLRESGGRAMPKNNGRAKRGGVDDPVAAVAASVRRKIGMTGGDDHEFLTAYYLALRSRLERQLLLDRAKADKRDTGPR